MKTVASRTVSLWLKPMRHLGGLIFVSWNGVAVTVLAWPPRSTVSVTGVPWCVAIASPIAFIRACTSPVGLRPSTATISSPGLSTAAAGRPFSTWSTRGGFPATPRCMKTAHMITNASTMLTAGPAAITTMRFQTGWL